MKNITVSVGGVNVAFDEDGTMRYIAMKVVNMDELHRWQEVRCASSRRYSLGAAAMRPFAVSTAPTNLFCFTYMTWSIVIAVKIKSAML